MNALIPILADAKSGADPLLQVSPPQSLPAETLEALAKVRFQFAGNYIFESSDRIGADQTLVRKYKAIPEPKESVPQAKLESGSRYCSSSAADSRLRPINLHVTVAFLFIRIDFVKLNSDVIHSDDFPTEEFVSDLGFWNLEFLWIWEHWSFQTVPHFPTSVRRSHSEAFRVPAYMEGSTRIIGMNRHENQPCPYSETKTGLRR